ncbi:MAG: hypothetical protein GHHEDOFH_02380 [Pseudorhodoplanes sp.]|nr:hypothetical protein [Pseudorhodoplanes sp.]
MRLWPEADVKPLTCGVILSCIINVFAGVPGLSGPEWLFTVCGGAGS